MPQRRKAPERRQNRGTTDVGQLVKFERPVPKVPALPGSRKLLAETTRAWESFWRSELAQLVEDVDSKTALSRLFRMYDSRERFERIVLAQPMTTGSTGQTIVNPAAAQVASLDARIAALEDRFGITPMARLKLGITFGAAQRSLEDVNREFDTDEEGGDQEDDPRVIDATSRRKA